MGWRLGVLAILFAGCSHAGARGPSSLAFDKTVLDTSFRAEGIAALDVDGDGHLDLATDQLWYAGPSFATSHAIRDAETFDPATQYSHCMAAYADDVNADGAPDLVIVPFPGDDMFWYENPRATDARWPRHLLAPAGSTNAETPIHADLFGDGHPVLVMGKTPELVLAWFGRGDDPAQPWTAHAISAPGFGGAAQFSHGLGAGDVDGDGKLDVLTGYGWFRQTADRDRWELHAADFGADVCSTMHAHDFDGDGRADVVCGRAHDYGLHVFFQQADGGFLDREIDHTVSQMHAVEMVDLDQDGAKDLVTGKRWWAHGPTGDPGAADPPLLVAWRGRPGGAFEERVIDDASGIGTSFVVVDLDQDGDQDVAVSNKRGLFVFRQR